MSACELRSKFFWTLPVPGVRKYIPRNKSNAITKPQEKVFHLLTMIRNILAHISGGQVQERSMFSVVRVWVVSLVVQHTEQHTWLIYTNPCWCRGSPQVLAEVFKRAEILQLQGGGRGNPVGKQILGAGGGGGALLGLWIDGLTSPKMVLTVSFHWDKSYLSACKTCL